MKTRWSKDDVDYLISAYEHDSVADIAKVLSRSYNAVCRKANYIGLSLSVAERKKRMSESARALSANQSGSNNPNWKGGITKDHYHYKKLQKQRYPERVRARDMVRHAVASGRLKKQACQVCGAEKTFAHHPDYTKPLEVIWLCKKHHREIHDYKH